MYGKGNQKSCSETGNHFATALFQLTHRFCWRFTSQFPKMHLNEVRHRRNTDDIHQMSQHTDIHAGRIQIRTRARRKNKVNRAENDPKDHEPDDYSSCRNISKMQPVHKTRFQNRPVNPKMQPDRRPLYGYPQENEY